MGSSSSIDTLRSLAKCHYMLIKISRNAVEVLTHESFLTLSDSAVQELITRKLHAYNLITSDWLIDNS